MKVKLAGKEFDVADDLAAAINDEIKTLMDAMKSEMANTKAAADRAEARADALQSEVSRKDAELKSRNDAAPEKIRELVRARKKLDAVAVKVLPNDILARLDSLEDREIKIEIIKAENPAFKLDGKSDHYIEAAFDYISETISTRQDKADIGREILDSRNDGSNRGPDPEAARKRAMERSKNAWKQTANS